MSLCRSRCPHITTIGHAVSAMSILSAALQFFMLSVAGMATWIIKLPALSCPGPLQAPRPTWMFLYLSVPKSSKTSELGKVPEIAIGIPIYELRSMLLVSPKGHGSYCRSTLAGVTI